MTAPVDEAVGREATQCAARLGEFVAGTRFGDLGEAITDRCKKSILDLIGVALCGSRSESAAEFSRYVARQRGPSESTILGGGTTTAYYAALLNGTYAHATELSETFNRAVVHPGNVVLPAGLAVAEREGASGAGLLTAAAVGYEVLIRVGLSLGAGWMMERGYHPPSAAGPFGAAAAVARLLDLDEESAGHALGMAACLTPTTLAGAFRGATVKELFEGHAAATGVLTGDLAGDGITGVAEWPHDWYRAVAGNSARSVLSDGLGTEWRVASGGLRIKMRAVAAMATPTLDAVQELLTSTRIPADAIDEVRVESSRRVTIGGERAPRTVVAARASVPFLTAYALVRQAEFLADPHLVRALTPQTLTDPAVLGLAEKVELVVDEELDREFEHGWPPKFAARVTVRAGGQEHVRYVDSFPRTSNLSWDDLAGKFRDITAGIVDPSRADELITQVRRLEEVDDVRDILALTRQ